MLCHVWKTLLKKIDISNIHRLETTKDRIKTAFDVVEIALDCLEKIEDTQNQPGKGTGTKNPTKQLAKPSDFFDFEDTDEDTDTNKNDDASKSTQKKKSNSNESSDNLDIGEKMADEFSDILDGTNKTPGKVSENQDLVFKICSTDLDKEKEKEIKKTTEFQRQFFAGEIPKESISDDKKQLMDLIEKNGISLIRVELPKSLIGKSKNLKVDCIVVKKMSRELIFSGPSVFPLTYVEKVGDLIPTPTEEMSESVLVGINLGTKLGRRLQIRSESNPIKTIRKKSGKLNKRQLHEAAFDVEDLFYKIDVEKHNKASLHISVDASSSMEGKKWYKTITATVAICKAASMVNNIRVTVSFRSTQKSGRVDLPYVVMAYDSNKDKFSKIKNLFPYLNPSGCTPEGLAFGAIMDLFMGITPDEEDRYFLNLSDGEPYYNLSQNDVVLSYYGQVGVNHTKSQVDKIRGNGIEILSYFINDGSLKNEEEKDQNQLVKNFYKMYGGDAKFIDVDNIVDLTRTMNELFLKKNG